MAAKSPADVFATNLRAARDRAGLSQEALGFACQLHPTEISLLERGKCEPRLTTIVKLAQALAIDPCALLNGLGDEPE